MRLKRVKCPEINSYYHCICRCVGLEKHLELARVKDVLAEMLWRAADFSGVQVITYCILDDHFHLLIRVPPRDAEITEEELLRRFRSLYRSDPVKIAACVQMLKQRSIRRELAVETDPAIEAFVNGVKTRMHDVSEFMKTLKQRFTQWYNRTHERIGTLWTERFKSLIVEDNPHLLATLAAYIEMNPVRIGICEKVQDHRWSGIRDFLDRKGIYSTLQVRDDESRDEHRLCYGHEFYRYAIFPLVEEAQNEFTEERKLALDDAKKRLNQGRKEALESMNLPLKTLLMGRLRHLAEGVAIGSILFMQVLASSANGVSHGRVPIQTGLQVDEDLKLMCLRKIRGPKIE